MTGTFNKQAGYYQDQFFSELSDLSYACDDAADDLVTDAGAAEEYTDDQGGYYDIYGGACVCLCGIVLRCVVFLVCCVVGQQTFAWLVRFWDAQLVFLRFGLHPANRLRRCRRRIHRQRYVT